MYIWSNLRNASGCNIYGRRLADEDIKKASMVIGLNLIMAVAALLIISGMQSFDFEDLCIEVFSAVGTVGLSTGITRQLNVASQIVIILLMFCGRIGTVTFASTFAYNRKQVKLLILRSMLMWDDAGWFESFGNVAQKVNRRKILISKKVLFV